MAAVGGSIVQPAQHTTSHSGVRMCALLAGLRIRDTKQTQLLAGYHHLHYFNLSATHICLCTCVRVCKCNANRCAQQIENYSISTSHICVCACGCAGVGVLGQ